MPGNWHPTPSRLVAQYDGVQIHDIRDKIEVLFTKTPRRGVRGALKYCADFERHTQFSYRARSNPQAIFDAQAVLREFYGEEIEHDQP